MGISKAKVGAAAMALWSSREKELRAAEAEEAAAGAAPAAEGYDLPQPAASPTTTYAARKQQERMRAEGLHRPQATQASPPALPIGGAIAGVAVGLGGSVGPVSALVTSPPAAAAAATTTTSSPSAPASSTKTGKPACLVRCWPRGA